MATKLKNFSRAWYTKWIAYAIIAATAAGVLTYVGNRENYESLLNLGDISYEESYEVRDYFHQWGNRVVDIAGVNPDELDIENKNYWNFDEIEGGTIGNSSYVPVTENENAEDTSEEAVINESSETETTDTETTDTETTETELTEIAETTVVDTGSADTDFTDYAYEDTHEEYNTNVYLQTTILNSNIAAEVTRELRDFYNVWWNQDGYVHLKITHDSEGDLHYQSIADVDTSKKIDLSYNNFVKEHPDIEKEVISGVLQKMKYNYQMSKEDLKYAVENNGLIFDIADKDSEELKEKYTALPIYVRIESNYVTNSSVHALIGNSMDGWTGNYYMENKVCYLGMDTDYYTERKAEWNEGAALGKALMMAMVIGAAVILVCFLYLALVTGRRPEAEGVQLYRIDHIWSEVQWTAAGCCIAGVVVLLAGVTFAGRVISDMYHYVAVALMVIMGMTVLAVLLSQIRLLKAKKWLDSFICVRLVKKFFGWVKKVSGIAKAAWKRGKLSKRACVWAIVLPLACATWIGVPFVIAFMIYMIYKHMGDFIAVCEGAEKIRNGQLKYQIQIKNKGGELEKLADDINEISQGLENAVSSELRSERLKAELISNVSHDLKTPLTSIVTYVDLLKQEEIENETANDYIEVIDRKAKRLTVLTNDLFEAAKASSGDMPVNIETVDLNALVRQALGEFDEKLGKAGLDIRLTLSETPAHVKADGRLVWRVIDNLLNNVVKYAQTGSRVYMEVKEMENTIGFVIKNISAYELNIPAEELMERFKRGDESRNSEGSGLGLSIANSLIDLQHGSFKISIDGDLFKAEFELPKSL